MTTLSLLTDNLTRQIANYNEMLVMAARIKDPKERVLALDLIREEMERTREGIERAKMLTVKE